MNAYMNQYKSNQVVTASPEKILIMLYDGAIRFVRQAKLAIEEGRTADKAKAISKAIAIITEFDNTLDREIGGEIADNLSSLYGFMTRELTAVNVRNDVERLAPVEKILLELRSAFAEAAEIVRRSQPQGQQAGIAGDHYNTAAAY